MFHPWFHPPHSLSSPPTQKDEDLDESEDESSGSETDTDSEEEEDTGLTENQNRLLYLCDLHSDGGKKWMRKPALIVLIYEGIVANVFDFDYAPQSDLIENRRVWLNISQEGKSDIEFLREEGEPEEGIGGGGIGAASMYTTAHNDCSNPPTPPRRRLLLPSTPPPLQSSSPASRSPPAPTSP